MFSQKTFMGAPFHPSKCKEQFSFNIRRLFFLIGTIRLIFGTTSGRQSTSATKVNLRTTALCSCCQSRKSGTSLCTTKLTLYAHTWFTSAVSAYLIGLSMVALTAQTSLKLSTWFLSLLSCTMVMTSSRCHLNSSTTLWSWTSWGTHRGRRP